MKMIKENSKLLVFLTIIVATVVVAMGDLFDYNLVAYSSCEINFYDKSLFTNNIDVLLNNHSVSPRITNFYVFYTLMNFGLSYESSYLVVYLLTCTLTAMAPFVFVLKETYSNDYLFVLLTTFVFIFSSIGISSGFSIFAPRSLFLGLGAAFFLCALGEVYLTTPSLGSKIFIVNVVSGVPCYIWPGPPSTSTGTLENLNRIKRINDWDCLSFEEKIVRARELGINYILFQTSEIPSNVNRVIQSEEFALVNVKLEPNYFD